MENLRVRTGHIYIYIYNKYQFLRRTEMGVEK